MAADNIADDELPDDYLTVHPSEAGFASDDDCDTEGSDSVSSDGALPLIPRGRAIQQPSMARHATLTSEEDRDDLHVLSANAQYDNLVVPRASHHDLPPSVHNVCTARFHVCGPSTSEGCTSCGRGCHADNTDTRCM